jgi:hypothetical protein
MVGLLLTGKTQDHCNQVNQPKKKNNNMKEETPFQNIAI